MNNWELIELENCESTNNLARQLKTEGKIADRTAIMSGFQSKGRGQGTNSWHSSANENLLCTLYIKTGLPVDRHFFLTIMVSLALSDTLKEIEIDSKIKWPNDIYAGNLKLAGILIENSLIGPTIADTIIGIGLNVNEKEFPRWLPNPVSIYQLTQKRFNVQLLLEKLTAHINNRFSELKNGHEEELFGSYTQKLFKLNTWSLFEAEGQAFNGQIHGVLPDGKLIVECQDGQLKKFLFGEVKYLL
ncbi:MAG: biotin--[acetyl-CoA-carboxylase] ligase [Bacteroidales bacterium]|nr:biotin--[acetyl-CoA-carboxylase] ligase [Bacteroidales bacterium]